MTSPAEEDALLAPLLAGLWRPSQVRIGAGEDDAAVLYAGTGEWVVTTDVLVDGVHFELERCGAQAAAYKALAVNLSDLAAMAAHPVGFLVGAVLPRATAASLLPLLLNELARASKEHGCALLGGDTNVADGPLTLAITALGTVGPYGTLRRVGAQVGDQLSVTGALGGSRALRHLRPVPRVAEAQHLIATGKMHAGMDLSDGLGRDLFRLCRASAVGACLDAAQIPIHADAHALKGDALAHALGDGEDFELLVAHEALAPQEQARLRALGVELIRVGEVRPASHGVQLRRNGQEQPLAPTGWDHFGPRDSDGARPG